MKACCDRLTASRARPRRRFGPRFLSFTKSMEEPPYRFNFDPKLTWRPCRLPDDARHVDHPPMRREHDEREHARQTARGCCSAGSSAPTTMSLRVSTPSWRRAYFKEASICQRLTNDDRIRSASAFGPEQGAAPGRRRRSAGRSLTPHCTGVAGSRTVPRPLALAEWWPLLERTGFRRCPCWLLPSYPDASSALGPCPRSGGHPGTNAATSRAKRMRQSSRPEREARLSTWP